MGGQLLFEALEIELLQAFIKRIEEDKAGKFNDVQILPISPPVGLSDMTTRLFLIQQGQPTAGLGNLFQSKLAKFDNFKLAIDLSLKSTYIKVT